MILNLVVLRAGDVERLGAFYEALGMSFVLEKHGSGPEHLASSNGGVTLEIYPRTPGRDTAGLRLGFSVDHVGDRLAAALNHGAKLISPVKDSAWGERAVISDPEGHVVELLQPRTLDITFGLDRT